MKLDAEGKASINFDIPQFNGTARVMAVAWSKEAVGHAEQDVIIRDPIVVTASLPKFLAPGDQRRACGSTSPTPTRRPATTRLTIAHRRRDGRPDR